MSGDGFRIGYPFQAHLGFRKVAFEDGFARFELEIGPHLANRVGTPHGGVYASMLDSALGGAGCWMGSPNEIRPAVTLTLNLTFLAAPKGDRLIAEGRRIGGGRTLFFSEGEVVDNRGALLARASGSFRYVK